MISRIQVLVCVVFLLVAVVALAEEKGHTGGKSHIGEEGHTGEKGHMGLKFKEYPISEEFRHVVESTSQEDSILGKAGDYVVKKSDVDRMLAYYPQETQSRLQENPAEMQTLVKRMLEVKIIADVARKENFDQIPHIKKQLDYVADDFLSKEYLARVVSKNVTVSEADLKKYYDQNKKQLGVPEQVWARHILFKVDPAASEQEKNKARKRAEVVLKRAKGGEDFEKLARAYSDDESSKANGGDLGYFTRGRTVQGFEKVVFYTKPGEISDIVETRYGYHIIKVEDHVDARERSFEEMRYYIRDELQQQMVTFKVKEFIREATDNVGMQVYSDRIAGK
jgi:parvulin-like peptidyl-prolyl isomerase